MPASSRPLYAVLHLLPGASSSDIARAYRRLALQFHPDRDPNGADAFKRIANAYAVLSDAESRRLYDATGVVPGDAGGAAGQTPQARSDDMQQQLRAFFDSYAGSAEEADDVAASYAACDGDFRRMVRERLIFDNGKPGEVQRLYALTRRLLDDDVDDKSDTTRPPQQQKKQKQKQQPLPGGRKLSATTAWARSTTPAALRKLERDMAKERAQAEEALRDMGLHAHTDSGNDTRRGGNDTTSTRQLPECGKGNDMLALQSMIQQRQRTEWASMVADLEDKYVHNTKPRPAARPPTSRKRTARNDDDDNGDKTRSQTRKHRTRA